MPTARGIRAGAAYVELFADDSRLIRGLGRASRHLKGFGAGVEAMGAGLRGVGMSMIGLGAALIVPLLGAARVFARMGDDLADMSVRTGVSVEALSELGFAARQSGSDLEGLETVFKRMQKVIVQAAGGSKGAAGALARLGLAVGDLEGLSPEEQFKLIADRISKIEDPTIKAAAALQLFGRSGTALLPMIENGAAGIEALQEQARRLGLTFSTQDAEAAHAFDKLLGQLWDVVRRGVFEIGASLAPTLTDLAHRIIDVVVQATEWIRENRQLIVLVLKLAAGAVAGGLALMILGYAISTVAAIFTGLGIILGAAGTALSALGAVLGFILSPLGLVVGGVAALVWASGVGGNALAWLRDRFTDLKTDALAAFAGIRDALATGDVAGAARILWLTLRLEWQKGIHWLMGYWLDWKTDLLKTASDGFYGVQALWTQATANLASAWAETMATLKTLWTVTLGFLKLGWIGIQSTFGTISREEAGAQGHQAVRETDRALANIDVHMNRQLGETEAKRKAALVGIGGDAAKERTRLDRDHVQDVTKDEADLAAARKDWEDSIAAARANRTEADQVASMAPGPAPGLKAKLGGLKDLLEDVEKRTVAVRGTFNPVALEGLGVADRLADWAQKTAKNTKKIADWTDDAEATFD